MFPWGSLDVQDRPESDYSSYQLYMLEVKHRVCPQFYSNNQLTGMTLRAGVSVYWPRITMDIEKVRDQCSTCNKIAPTQPKAREQALRPSGKGAQEQWSANARNPPFLKVGDDVMIQNQRGNYPKQWGKRGVVMEVLPHDQYNVRVEGSRQLTLRNRRYLRKYTRSQPQ